VPETSLSPARVTGWWHSLTASFAMSDQPGPMTFDSWRPSPAQDSEQPFRGVVDRHLVVTKSRNTPQISGDASDRAEDLIKTSGHSRGKIGSVAQIRQGFMS
jgi:hypothetical protein